MRRFAIAAVCVLVIALVFGAVTLFALEGRGVAVLHTLQADGTPRLTRVWFAEERGVVWLEAATPERPFYKDIAARPVVTVELRRSPFDSTQKLLRGKAELVAEPEGHRRIRNLLNNKYGWADRWIGFLQDTSTSRAIRIAPTASIIKK